MHLLVVQNHRDEHAGLLGDALGALAIRLDTRQPWIGDPLPSRSDGYDGAVILGGPQSAMDDAGYPYFPDLLALLRDFRASGRPVLGICLGAQLMARAHAAKHVEEPVRPNAVVEIGFDPPIEFNAAAQADPLLAGVPPILNLMHWHHDTVEPPPGSVILARSRDCAIQAFRLDQTQYAVQFHPEVTRAMVVQWLDTHEGDVDRDYPGLRQRIGSELDAHIAQANAFAVTLAHRFAALVSASARPRGARSMKTHADRLGRSLAPLS